MFGPSDGHGRVRVGLVVGSGLVPEVGGTWREGDFAVITIRINVYTFFGNVDPRNAATTAESLLAGDRQVFFSGASVQSLNCL